MTQLLLIAFMMASVFIAFGMLGVLAHLLTRKNKCGSKYRKHRTHLR